MVNLNQKSSGLATITVNFNTESEEEEEEQSSDEWEEKTERKKGRGRLNEADVELRKELLEDMSTHDARYTLKKMNFVSCTGVAGCNGFKKIL